MYLSPHTIRARGKSIYRKPGVPSRSQAVAGPRNSACSRAQSGFLSLYLSDETAIGAALGGGVGIGIRTAVGASIGIALMARRGHHGSGAVGQ